MDEPNVKFCGQPSGRHGPYTFYKSLKFEKDNNATRLSVGDFFFVKVNSDTGVGIGELQLLWEDKNADALHLASVRLYFLPQHTPEGRSSQQGQDEILAEGEKVVLRVEDLLNWIVIRDISWDHGIIAATAPREEAPVECLKDQLNGLHRVKCVKNAKERLTLNSNSDNEDKENNCNKLNGCIDDGTVSVDSSNAKLKTNNSNSDLTDGKSADIKSENLKNGDIKNENTDNKIDNKVTLNGDSDTNSDIKCESTCETHHVKDSKEKREGSNVETENESAEKDCVVKTEPTCHDNDRDIKNEAKPEDLCENGTNGSETVKDTEVEELSQNDDEDAKLPGPFCNVTIVSYPQYCRYRTIMKRLESVEDKWMKNAIVQAIGGFTVADENTHVLFCRNTCDLPVLEEHEYRLDNLGYYYAVPNLKGRPRKRRPGKLRKDSYLDSDNSNDSSDLVQYRAPQRTVKSDGIHKIKIVNIKDKAKMTTESPNKNDIVSRGRPRRPKILPLLSESELMEKLYKFMKDRNTPIDRIPSLGFRQINMYTFYKVSRNLGGYEQITIKRQWKHLYDKIGGNPANTSAATCTRRHYEKLLLPFELHEKGYDEKAIAKYVTKRRKNSSGSESKEDDHIENKVAKAGTPTPDKPGRVVDKIPKVNQKKSNTDPVDFKDELPISEALRDSVRLDIYKRHQEMLLEYNLPKNESLFSLDNKHSVHHLISQGNTSSTNRSSPTLPPRSFHHLIIHNKVTDSHSTLINGSVHGGDSSDLLSSRLDSSVPRPSVIQHTPSGLSLHPKDSKMNNHKRPYPFVSSLFNSPPYIPLPTPPPAHSNKQTPAASAYNSPSESKQPRLATPLAAPLAHQTPDKAQPPLNIIDVDHPADFTYRRPELFPLSFQTPSRSSGGDTPLNLSVKKPSERSERSSHQRSTPLSVHGTSSRSYHQTSPLPMIKKPSSAPYARDSGSISHPSQQPSSQRRSPSATRTLSGSSSANRSTSSNRNSGHSHTNSLSNTRTPSILPTLPTLPSLTMPSLTPSSLIPTSLSVASLTPNLSAASLAPSLPPASLTSSALSHAAAAANLATMPSIAGLTAMSMHHGFLTPMLHPVFPQLPGASMLGQIPGLLPPHMNQQMLYGAGPSSAASLSPANVARTLSTSASGVKGLTPAEMLQTSPYLLPYQQLYAAEALRTKSK